MAHDGRPSWWLVDGEERNRAAPRSFFIPPRERRAALRPGRSAVVEVGCEPRVVNGEERTGERINVQIYDVLSDGSYRGTLGDRTVVTDGFTVVEELCAGDDLRFDARHVVDIAYLPGELVYDPAAVAAVDPRVLGDLPPARLMRIRPPGNATRIWVAALEDELPPELLLIPLGQLAEYWPELEPAFIAGEGDWIRHPRRPEYVRTTPGALEPAQRAAIRRLVQAAALCLRYPDDPRAASAEGLLESALEDVLDLHWPEKGEPKSAVLEGVSHPGIQRAHGRVLLTGKAWVRGAPARAVSLDVSPRSGGTLTLGEAQRPARHWWRRRPTGRSAGARDVAAAGAVNDASIGALEIMLPGSHADA